MSFHHFKLQDPLARALKSLGFTEATPIQHDAIPPGLEGRDILACAATGSGKTAAFGLPILNHLIPKSRGTTRVLILTPTRELAVQVEEHLGQLAQNTRIKSAAIYGGTGMAKQQRAFQEGFDILVATPGRLLDHLNRPYAKLRNIEFLVLDEVDRMLDMGFLPDVRKILQQVPEKRQSFMFSATLPPAIKKLASEMLTRPATLNVERRSLPASGIRQQVYMVPQLKKSDLLACLLSDQKVESALVFTRTKRRADRLAQQLKKLNISVSRIHGDRTQGQRTQALEGFKKGQYRVLVATDVAARGIDIVSLSHVINFDLPETSEDYIHRVGRTARASAKGEAYTLVTPEEERDLRQIERSLGKPIQRALVEGFDYHVPREVLERARGGFAGGRRVVHGDSERRPRHGGRRGMHSESGRDQGARRSKVGTSSAGGRNRADGGGVGRANATESPAEKKLAQSKNKRGLKRLKRATAKKGT